VSLITRENSVVACAKLASYLQDMNTRKLLAVLLLGGSATFASDLSAGVRLGARTGPSEFTPLLGLGVMSRYMIASVDGWIQPFRFKEVSPSTYRGLSVDFQRMERRWGLTPGIGIDFGNRVVGLVPSAGWEVSWGAWSGDRESPPFESVGWVGGNVRLGRVNYLGGKYYPNGARAGDWRIEYVAQFGGKRR
jgi:hypothetical protein